MKNIMTDLETAQFDRFVRNHIGHILACASLTHYYMRTLEPKKMSEGFTITPSPTYLEFGLNYSEDYVSTELHKGEYDDLLRTLCHEVTHIISAEIEVIPKMRKMSDVFDPMFERFTEHASRWLYELYTKVYMPEHGIEPNTGIAKKKLK